MTILQKPDALSFSLNILPFRISSTEQVSFILYHGENEILSHLYEPNTDGVVEIDLRDIIHNRLSIILSDSSEAYEQVNLVGDFTADFGSSTYNFRVVRGGVEHLADSATNFLKQNFLTWQPTVKMVTYSCPEFLTYYSVDVSALKLKAYFVAADGTITDETINYADLAAGKAYTIPLQYACVAAKFGSRLPSYYDVWVESKSGDRLTYVQRYQADNAKSLHEDWILFDNSLGGIDTFRAYGVDAMTAKHTHNVAEIAEESVEYRVDTERQHRKSTGYLQPSEARWLYDFFPSTKKYIYIDNTIRSIVVIESDVKRDNKLLPTGYTFTYKFAEARPLLNLPRTEVPANMLNIQVPDLGSFSTPPRLVEIPRLPLTEGALFPVQSPYSEEWGTTTLASLATLIGSLLADSVGEGGGVGHIHNNLDLLSILSYIDKYLLVNGERIKAGYADVAGDTEDLKGRFLRKDKADVAAALITFAQGLFSKGAITIGKDGFAEGMTGFGGRIDENANAELESLKLRRFLEVPEFRFNRTEVTLGNEWRGPGAGIIERVEPDVDSNGNQLMSGTAWLKLEEGEFGAIAVGDICMGIFHSQNASENSVVDSDDSKGTFQFAGFYTCYFTITEITGSKNNEFRYQLRPISDLWKIRIHPSAAMTFNCFGSFTDPDRMTSQYTTRTYTRLLVYQNTWEIKASNIAMQWGDLNNLAVHGINMSGYSAYLNNIYMTGAVKQINAAGHEIQVVNDRGEYIPGELYDYYDRVSYRGSLWLCVAENGTNTEPSKNEVSWLLQVEAGQSVTSHPNWKSNNTPYPASTILKFADRIWISNKETSDPPLPLYTDPDGNYYKTPEGGYYIAGTTQSADWDLLLDASGLVDGEDGASIEVRYSADGTNWHFPFVEGDIYMQQRIGENSPWSNTMPFVGKDGKPGDPGTDGKYPEYQWAVNDSATIHPTTGWQDTPPTTGDGQYLWMRTRIVDPNTLTATSWSSPVRIKGDTGESIKPIGAWHSGLNVPKLGVVTMAGTSFLAKVETNKPPMFCYTDPDGNYYKTPEGGYYLTGEINSNEYDILVQSGKDGSDGKDYEWIYQVKATDDVPSTPNSVQQDDYVPSGWNDNPTGVSETIPYEFASFRTKKDGVWSTFSKPALWAKFGKDGIQGLQGIQGEKGEQGIQGEKGDNGQSSYFHIKYADDANGTNMNETGGDYIGTYVDFTLQDSTDSKKYTWVKTKGAQGERGEQGIPGTNGDNGQTSYLHIAYANSADGKDGFSVSDSKGKLYIGQYTDFIINDSTDPSKYKWTLIKGEQGLQGIQGEKGDGFEMMGNWHSGLNVPIRGVVQMGGGTYVAKKSTARPPLFCYKDHNGNYYLTPEGGYYLTGEKNTEEYDTWVDKPLDGKDGKDGVDGKDGKNGVDGKPGQPGAQGIPGMQGCILRYSEWQPNYEWRNDTNKTEEELKDITGGIRYLDCAFVRNDATSTGWDVYYATETHISTANNAPTVEGSKWKEFSMNVPAIFTNIILAKQAHIDLLQGNDIMAKKADGTVTAGMSGGSDGIRFWAGATQENKAKAPFRVNEQGESWLTNAHVSGEVNATSGVFKDVKIESGTIGGFTIEKGTLRTSTLGSGRIIIEPGINKFIRINDDEFSPLFYARNDSGVIMQLNAYGNNATALELLSNSSGNGVALRSTGDAYLVGRYSSVPSFSPHEKIMIAGLSVSCKKGSSFTSPTNVSPSTAWVDFLIANGDITLPSAKNCAGKVLFVKAKGVISCQETSGGIVLADGTTIQVAKDRGNHAMIYISDGNSWYEFYCG